jgi:chitinase
MPASAAYSTAVASSLLMFAAACHDATVPETPQLALEPKASASQSGAKDAKRPTTPTNLRVTSVGAYSVSLAWGPSTDNSGTFSYRIHQSQGYEETAPQAATSFTFTSHLDAQQTYSFYVYAVDASGNASAASNTVTATLPPDVTPPAAPALSATDIGPTHITLAWSATDDDPRLYYSISMNGNPDPNGATSSTSRTYYLLQPATTYTFTAKARDRGGNWSPVSAPFAVTTKPRDASDTQAPTTPTNVYAGSFSSGDNEFEVTWTASTDNVDPQSLIRYDIYLNGTLIGITVGTTRATDYGVIGTNKIEVIAVDAAGNRSPAGTTTLIIQ